jgi:hypothetical protein
MKLHTKTRHPRSGLQYVGAMLTIWSCWVQATTPTADYQFQGNLSSSVAGAPDLTYIGASHSFPSENVFGTAQTVLNFLAGSGVELTPTTSVLTNPGIYTIVFTARIQNSANGFSKYVDFANGTLDAGLYNDAMVLTFSSPTVYSPRQLLGYDYEDIALARDAAGQVRGYVNGVFQFTVDDSATQHAVISASNALRFFVDDSVSSTEQSDGAVARLRIWDTALSDQAIAAVEGYVTPTLVADYAGSLTSAVGGAPNLVAVGGGISTASETVLYYLPPQTVLTFAAGSGLSLSPASNILPEAGQYTIALQERLDGVSSDGYSKLIDFANGTADFGLYDYLSHLTFFDYNGGSSASIGTQYADIVLTRDKSGALAGYYDGKVQFWTTDSIRTLGVVDGSNTLRFFLDDNHGAGMEMSAGAVARVRVWKDALSAADVLQLTDSIFHNGFEVP